jgi:hypothetical protein
MNANKTAAYDAGGDKKGDDPSRAEQLVSFVLAQATLFHDDKGDGFARVFDDNGRPDTHRLSSSAFQRWLDSEVYSTGGKLASAGTKKDAIALHSKPSLDTAQGATTDTVGKRPYRCG